MDTDKKIYMLFGTVIVLIVIVIVLSILYYKSKKTTEKPTPLQSDDVISAIRQGALTVNNPSFNTGNLNTTMDNIQQQYSILIDSLTKVSSSATTKKLSEAAAAAAIEIQNALNALSASDTTALNIALTNSLTTAKNTAKTTFTNAITGAGGIGGSFEELATSTCVPPKSCVYGIDASGNYVTWNSANPTTNCGCYTP